MRQSLLAARKGLPADGTVARAGRSPGGSGPCCARRCATCSHSGRPRSASCSSSFLVCAVFADVIAPYDPHDQLQRHRASRVDAPSPASTSWAVRQTSRRHAGHDGNSRDVFSRVVHGARISLPIGFVTVGLAILIGAFIGAIAGFAGGGRTTC